MTALVDWEVRVVSLNRIPRVLVLASCLLAFAGQALSTDVQPNKRRGQVYFKLVCTVCHIQMVEKAIPPDSRSMDEWRAYFDADKHDASGATRSELSYYVSLEYRDTIQDSNKAARKFLKLSDEQLIADVRKFSVTGARDSDTPASCSN